MDTCRYEGREAVFAFPELLRNSRKEKKIVQQQLPRVLGVSLRAVRAWESFDYSQFPEESKLEAIAEAYQIDPETLKATWMLSKKGREEEKKSRGSIKNSLLAFQ